MALSVENPEIVTVQIMNAGDVTEFLLTRDEFNELAIEAAVRGLAVEAWIKEKLLILVDGPSGIGSKRGLS